jgi:hypothetical protein
LILPTESPFLWNRDLKSARQNPFPARVRSAQVAGHLAVSEKAAMKKSVCYLSTPEHVRSFVGKFIYIYTDKGELTLTDTALRFVGKSGLPADIPFDSITHVSRGHYAFWAKPFGLEYIAVRHRDGETEQTALLTPTRSWATPTWKTNEIVAEWTSALQSARSRCVPPGVATDSRGIAQQAESHSADTDFGDAS